MVVVATMTRVAKMVAVATLIGNGGDEGSDNDKTDCSNNGGVGGGANGDHCYGGDSSCHVCYSCSSGDSSKGAHSLHNWWWW